MTDHLEIHFDHVDSSALRLALPQRPTDGSPRAIKLRQLRGLRGHMWQAVEGPHLNGMQATEAQLDELSLWFGTVHLGTEGETELLEIEARSQPRDNATDLDLSLASLKSKALKISVGDSVDIGAHTQLASATLQVRGPEGDVRAERGFFAHLHVALPSMTLTFSNLRATDLHVSWKRGAFFMRASELQVDTAQVTTATAALSAEQLSLQRFELDRGDIVAEGLQAEALSMRIPPREAHAADESAREQARGRGSLQLLDDRLFDTLSGQINADVSVDVGLPVGSRKAVHRFRLPVEGGTLDYRTLEGGLSALEDSLLDFTLRDGHLVLELGVPLLPTRGHGKPLLRWPLEGKEVALAMARRVRLARLPRFERKPIAEERSKPRSSRPPMALRSLSLRDLNITLAMQPPNPPLDAALRSLSFDGIQVQGKLQYGNGAAPSPGQLVGSMQAMVCSLRALAVGNKDLTAGQLRMASAGAVVGLQGVRPDGVDANFEGVEADRISLTARRSAH